jgi:hypothetical protein
MAKDPGKTPASRNREDGRRQILLYLRADLIASLKRQALSEDVPAYELAEEAIDALLKVRKRGRK